MGPQFVDPAAVHVATHRQYSRSLRPSQMFWIRDGLAAFRQDHPHTPTFDASQGDGGASLAPIHVDELMAAIENFFTTTSYGTPEGDLRVRQAILERYYRAEGIAGLTPHNIVTTTGGRDALQKWYQAITLQSCTVGHCVIVSAAPWTSYAQGGYLCGFNMLRAPREREACFRLTPTTVGESAHFSREHRMPVAGLIITTPDNPTGTWLKPDQLATLIEFAVSRGIPYVLLDLMYDMILDEGLHRYDMAALFQTLSHRRRVSV